MYVLGFYRSTGTIRHSPLRKRNFFAVSFYFGLWVKHDSERSCMLVILKRDDEEISLQAAQLIATAVHKKPALVLGLAPRHDGRRLQTSRGPAQTGFA